MQKRQRTSQSPHDRGSRAPRSPVGDGRPRKPGGAKAGAARRTYAPIPRGAPKVRRPRKPPHAAPVPEEGETASGVQRLQKVLAAAGLGSRRQCEELIESGRVEVDKQVVTALGTKVDPQQQQVRVDGEPLLHKRLVHYVVHKPQGVVCTNYDPSGRTRVIDLLPDSHERLFAVGRLDMSSEGLILVTNDGELANQLTHPRYGVEKTYQVLVAGTIEKAEASKLLKGVHLSEGFAKVSSLKMKAPRGRSTQMQIVLTEGRNREIRRLLARVGHKVLRLKRVAIAGVRLAELPPGAHRPVTPAELQNLREAASGARATAHKKPASASFRKSSNTGARGATGSDRAKRRARPS